MLVPRTSLPARLSLREITGKPRFTYDHYHSLKEKLLLRSSSRVWSDWLDKLPARLVLSIEQLAAGAPELRDSIVMGFSKDGFHFGKIMMFLGIQSPRSSLTQSSSFSLCSVVSSAL
jgi:hypothetical protein